jgi:hypothetical protein
LDERGEAKNKKWDGRKENKNGDKSKNNNGKRGSKILKSMTIHK